jgi:hypothetical protein
MTSRGWTPSLAQSALRSVETAIAYDECQIDKHSATLNIATFAGDTWDKLLKTEPFS